MTCRAQCCNRQTFAAAQPWWGCGWEEVVVDGTDQPYCDQLRDGLVALSWWLVLTSQVTCEVVP